MSTNTSLETSASKSDASPNGKKNSTSEVPMVGLSEAIDFIKLIHEKGLERAPMPKVAEGTGYATASSTPFYRRVSSARHFQLISSRGADLTELGQDCIKPTSEDATHRALVGAIQNVAAYSEPLIQYNGKRINQDILANWFERKFELNEGAANSCSKAFVDSLRYVGALSADNLLNFSSEPTVPLSNGSVSTPTIPVSVPLQRLGESQNEGFRFELILDPQSRRKIVIYSPSTVTSAELKRIQDWLGFQLLVADSAE